MKKELIKFISSITKGFAAFSFGFYKGKQYAKKKLKKDNQRIIDMLRNK